MFHTQTEVIRKESSSVTEIHLFSGLMSRNVSRFRMPILILERLIDDLPSTADAVPHIHDDWPAVRSSLLRKHRSGTLQGPVIFIVHSQGQESAGELCASLNGIINVDYLAAISPTLGRTKAIPTTCRRIDEFLETSGGIHAGRQLSRAFGGRKGRVLLAPNYIQMNPTGYAEYVIQGTDHISVANSPFVRKHIVNQVKLVLNESAHTKHS